ncbi:hypothetical protein FisN_2Hh110 [Fistulifera solaris]|uniref:V-type proton ATPase proteolipid subunit n=1 Tax=Fistulifera solaris TaxID=1519565 RepID=A0A1Z5KPY3_FISSO|nr:hypothetical protein FisN_2Lh110 [Fistulifera solaris]GAX28071.1 hypothetical protein FisN_2Hh110 [Fistulifera solaris]|eukprot:GAX18455.1 hypothetical protein FisN_2Lh110 [Fistulifera solaris]
MAEQNYYENNGLNDANFSYTCPHWAPVLGFAGIASAVVFANLGGAYGTAKAGQGLMAMGVRSPELLMKNIIPVVMAGVLGIYGLIVAVILNGKFTMPAADGFATYSQYNGFSHLAAGLCCGLCSLASGLAIGIAADAGTRAVGAQSHMAASWKKMGFTGDSGGQVTSSGDALFVGTVLIQVFASNLGLYGLIAALILSQSEYQCDYGAQ